MYCSKFSLLCVRDTVPEPARFWFAPVEPRPTVLQHCRGSYQGAARQPAWRLHGRGEDWTRRCDHWQWLRVYKIVSRRELMCQVLGGSLVEWSKQGIVDLMASRIACDDMCLFLWERTAGGLVFMLRVEIGCCCSLSQSAFIRC